VKAEVLLHVTGRGWTTIVAAVVDTVVDFVVDFVVDTVKLIS
jgi:PhoPQ-activated pathogenicity-related protein